MKSFKEFLSEASNSCEDKFGQYLFGQFKEFYGKRLEVNTPREGEIFELLVKFVRGDYVSGEKDAILIKAFKELDSCRKKYGKILKPNAKTLYRGLIIKRSIIKKIDFKDSVDIGAPFNAVGTYTYKGKSKVQSWSEKQEVAVDFAKDSYYNNLSYKEKEVYAPVVLKTTFPEKELLFNTEFMNKLSTDWAYDEEFEIIRIENKQIKCKIYVIKDMLTRKLKSEIV